jgi:HEAT repeat protein
MPSRAKKSLLPDFISAMRDASPGVRNNATIALKYYPEEAQTVVPLLFNALRDPAPKIRKLAADALKKIDPQALKQAEAADRSLQSDSDPLR